MKITLDGKAFEVKPITLGRLKIVLPALNRAAQVLMSGQITEQAIGDVTLVIAEGIGVPLAEAEAIPASLEEIIAAIDIIAQASGMKPREVGTGEKLPAESSNGTISTAG